MDRSHVSSPLLEPLDPTPLHQPTPFCCCFDSFIHGFNGICAQTRRLLASILSTFLRLLTQEPAKTIHAFKMALALSSTFLLVLLKGPYSIFGSHAIWAIMTVIVVFEFTIGATLSKGCNRGVGTLLAGLLALLVGQLAQMSGGITHPIIVGVSTFVIGAVATFAKLWPAMKSYEFGLRTFIMTYSIIIVSEYRQGDPVDIAINRFLIILLGAAIGLCINIFVLPIWAGEELHEFISNNFSSLADSLEACVNEYLRGAVLERVPSKILMGLAADDPVYKGYRLALVSASKEESLASFASWEPPHGKFRLLKYPWNKYVKVGAVLRHCTYSVVALHGCLRSAIQAPISVRKIFEDELRALSKECAEVLRKLSYQVRNMEKGDVITILDGVRSAVDRLQCSLYLHSYLLVHPESGILDENHKSGEVPVSVIRKKKKNGYAQESISSIQLDVSSDPSERMYRRLYSWPQTPLNSSTDMYKDPGFRQRVRVLESASALSLGTFTTLLVEVALRLDYVVEAVEELSELAHFRAAPRSGKFTEVI